MGKIKVHINKVLKITPGQLHSWCDSNVGRIRKENKNVPEEIWNQFIESKKLSLMPLYQAKVDPIRNLADLKPGMIIPLSWWKRLVLFIKKILKL